MGINWVGQLLGMIYYEFVLGLLLFATFIDEINEEILYEISKFTDDIKIIWKIYSPDDI